MNAQPGDIKTAIAEYNALSSLERAYWHSAADSARPVDAWAAWKAQMAQTARAEGEEVNRSQ